MQRLTNTFDGVIWLNPVRQDYWGYTHSIGLCNRLLEGRMFPITLAGLEAGMSLLSRK